MVFRPATNPLVRAKGVEFLKPIRSGEVAVSTPFSLMTLSSSVAQLPLTAADVGSRPVKSNAMR
jgi:hypothetical protein